MVLFGAAMGTLWLGVIPLVNGLVVQIFGLRFLSTLTGIAFLSHQAGSFLGAWGGGYLFDLMGSYDLAWKIGVFVGLVAGTMQLLMNDRPTARMQALQRSDSLTPGLAGLGVNRHMRRSRRIAYSPGPMAKSPLYPSPSRTASSPSAARASTISRTSTSTCRATGWW